MTPDFAAVLLAYAVQGAGLLALFAAGAAAARRIGADGPAPALWGFCAAALAGYATFYAFLPGWRPGYAACGLVAALAASSLALHRRHLRAGDLLAPALSLSAGLLYLAVAHLGVKGFSGDLQASLAFERTMPYDDRIPLLFAETVFHRLPSRTGPDAFGWYFSDRPPLQAGFVLLFSPLWRAVDPELAYRALGTALQALAVGSTWLLCRALGFGRGEARFATLAFALSGFSYYESVYAWPKLLAAAFLFVGCAALGPALLARRRAGRGEALLLGLGTGLALLSHGAVAFAVIPLAFLVAASRLLDLRGALLAAGAVLCLLAPWSAYGRFVDPNDGRLIRMHLTGADYAAKGPLLDAFRESYSKLTPAAWIEGRIENLELLWGDRDLDALVGRLAAGLRDERLRVPLVDGDDTWAITPSKLRYDLVSLGTALRVDQTVHVFRALGLFDLAWPLLLLLAVPRVARTVLDRGFVALTALTALSCLCFATLEFGHGTVTVHGSYSIVAGLFVIAAVLLHRVWRRGAWWVFGANAALTLLIWVVSAPGAVLEPVRRVQPAPAAVALAALALLVALLFREAPVSRRALLPTQR
ncbi:hypothetical protein [Lichenibacterium dinghuense]|uniref:hypothetical protein n=1 Tax=Lichenibacterium dinghuense TaxID=2895977 RepID=UPI001F205C7F|nr:hypothetical protein [Lichenibacterium sp. 6Y81]